MEGRTGIGFEAVDEYVIAKMRSANIPGLSLAIVKGDQMIYLRGYGKADPSGRPVTPQTPFMIGSITKSITAFAVMQLAEAGKVDLDTPVQRYLPWFRTADLQASAKVTARMLINQTSGLPQRPTLVTWTWPDEPLAIERHVRLLATEELDFPPGQSFAYSNANYVTLGMLVQAVTGQPYEEYIKQQIFSPLDMQNSFVSQDEAIRHGMATGYRWWFGIPVPVTLPYNRANLPAGFIISSAEDIAHYLIAQMNGGWYRDIPVLSPDGIAVVQSEPPPGEYGLGWESVRIDGRRLINADGATANFQASIFFDPEERVGVFIAANAMNALDGLSSSRDSASLGARSMKEIIRRILDRDDKKTFLFSALITTRGMAHSILNMATLHPIPKQGLGQRRVSLIFNLTILALTALLVIWLSQVPEWYRLLVQQGITGWSDLAWRSSLIAFSHFAWPLLLLLSAGRVPQWLLLVLYQPDLVFWLKSTAVAMSIKGLFQIVLIWQVFWQNR